MTPNQYKASLEKLMISQYKLAKFIGMSHRQLYRYSDGTTKIPKSFEILLKYMIKYGYQYD